jgi:AraC-like DNA-binding protein
MPIDRLTPLLTRFQPQAHVFFAGQLCETFTSDAQYPVGHIHWVFEGQVDLFVDGEATERVDAPSVIFLPNPLKHTLEPRPQAEVLCCEFDFGHREANPLTMLPSRVVVIDMTTALAFETLGQLIREEFASGRCGQQFGLTQLMQYFVLLLLRHLISMEGLPCSITRALADPRLLRAVTAMHNHPQRPWTLANLAQEAGMSRAAFASHFKRATAQTPLDYLTDWRLSLVKANLLAGEAVKQSAHDVGYASSATLIRVFQRKFGVSPTEWRDQQPTGGLNARFGT